MKYTFMCQIITEFQYLSKTETVTMKLFLTKKTKPNSKQKDVLMEMPESSAGHQEFPEQPPSQSDEQSVN